MKIKLFNIIIFIFSFSIVIFLLILLIYDPYEKVWELGKGYEIAYDANSDLVLGGSRNNLIVSGPIIKYLYDDKYIIIKEKPREKIYKIYKLDSIYNQEVKRIRDFDAIQYYDYWIIDKHLDSIYGPYQKPEYLKKFKELNLADSLLID